MVRRTAGLSCMQYLGRSIVGMAELRDPDFRGFLWTSLPSSRRLRLDRCCMMLTPLEGDFGNPAGIARSAQGGAACKAPWLCVPGFRRVCPCRVPSTVGRCDRADQLCVRLLDARDGYGLQLNGVSDGCHRP